MRRRCSREARVWATLRGPHAIGHRQWRSLSGLFNENALPRTVGVQLGPTPNRPTAPAVSEWHCRRKPHGARVCAHSPRATNFDLCQSGVGANTLGNKAIADRLSLTRLGLSFANEIHCRLIVSPEFISVSQPTPHSNQLERLLCRPEIFCIRPDSSLSCLEQIARSLSKICRR